MPTTLSHPGRPLVDLVLAAVCAWFFTGPSTAIPAGPTVAVPCVDQTLQIAPTAAPGAGVKKAEFYQLLYEGSSDISRRAQRIPAVAPDGTVAEDEVRIAASVKLIRGQTPGQCRFTAMPRSGSATPAQPAGEVFRFKAVTEKSLGLWDGDRPVLVYNHGTITNEKVPKKDARRSRGCYIHPVYGLSGEVLTEDFPKDHYHHHGVFWSWPHVGIDGKEYDLWVYSNIQQRFVRWLAKEAGPVAAVLGVENGWFVGDKKVMIERVWLRVYKPADGARAIDLEFTFIPVDRPITLRGAEGKSYGGLNLRYAPRPEKETLITVPGGKTKADLPDTPLVWADLTARFAGAPGPSGAAIFVDPGHPDFPPTWLTRHYGILCVGWPGVKAKTFPPGEPIHMNYRVWIHKDAAEPEQLQKAFEAYGAAMKAQWK